MRKKYTKEEIATILAAGRDGLTLKETEAKTGLSWMICRYYLKKEGLYQDKPPVVNPDVAERMLALAQTEGATVPRISKALGIDPGLVRFHLRKVGVTLRPAVRGKYTKEQRTKVIELRLSGQTTEDIATATGVAVGSVRAILGDAGVTISKEHRIANLRQYTDEQRAKVIELRQLGKPEKEILALCPMSRATFKKILREASVKVAPEVAVANSQAAILAKNPNHMADIRKSLTSDVRKRAGAALRARIMSDPTMLASMGQRSKNWWDTLSADQRSDLRPKGVDSAAHLAMLAREQAPDADALMRRYAAPFKGEFLGPYVHSKAPTWWKCEKGHLFRAIPNSVQQGHWCPACANRISRVQLEIYAYVLSLAPDAVLDDRMSLKGHLSWRGELDVYVPSVKFGLEMDGLFWHSEAAPGFRRNGARDKAAAARAAGLKYLMVYEDEWRNKRSLVEDMIRVRLGKFEGERLNARSLDLRLLERNSDFRAFFDSSHLNGHVQARYAYGLFWADRLVACASVRTNHRGDVELARLATAPGVLVRGAAGRLVGAIRAKESRLVSYSDNRLSDGGVYQKLGFLEDTLTDAPSYYYTDFKTRVWRYRCRRVNEPEVLAAYPTEAEQAHGGVFSTAIFGDDRALWRIEDAGHRRWVLS